MISSLSRQHEETRLKNIRLSPLHQDMKTTWLLIFATTLITLPLRAEDTFPKPGSSYRVTYTVKPDASFCPDEVKVLRKGAGGWALVEAKKGPDSVTVSFWLNFDFILSASEVQRVDK